jgi:hypothetical protein
MASVVIKGMGNLKKISDEFDRQLEEATKQVMADIMLKIVVNTNAGRNAYNVPFLAYAKKTIAKKREQGKSTKPNMQDTSSMISSLDFLPARKTRTFIVYKIGVKGSYKGVSNKAKLKYLDEHKNYYILRRTPFYIKIAKTHLNRFAKRFSSKY